MPASLRSSASASRRAAESRECLIRYTVRATPGSGKGTRAGDGYGVIQLPWRSFFALSAV
jgi:hypothetical protein